MPEIIATLLFSLVKRRIVSHGFDRQISLCKILYVRCAVPSKSTSLFYVFTCYSFKLR